jgi:hypothetical protein
VWFGHGDAKLLSPQRENEDGEKGREGERVWLREPSAGDKILHGKPTLDLLVRLPLDWAAGGRDHQSFLEEIYPATSRPAFTSAVTWMWEPARSGLVAIQPL